MLIDALQVFLYIFYSFWVILLNAYNRCHANIGGHVILCNHFGSWQLYENQSHLFYFGGRQVCAPFSDLIWKIKRLVGILNYQVQIQVGMNCHPRLMIGVSLICNRVQRTSFYLIGKLSVGIAAKKFDHQSYAQKINHTRESKEIYVVRTSMPMSTEK